ncbi:MAG: right-handed parallel beta-helix repeat-containing protein, partial [Candidatus Bathyarchaeota archaeon]|nr:right-handed parallel beta-helix repeat-containing protein [Candidatus Bathyarchaeota archaeon]
MKEKAPAIMLILLLATLLLGALEIQRIEAEPTTWRVDDDGHKDFRMIQDAVNIAQQGDTVFVYNGTYHEHVVINKSISLIGEDRSTTVIDGKNAGTVVLVTADNVIVKGFAVRNGRSGIVVSDSHNCLIKDNLVEDNSYQGIFINKSWNCTVSGNHAVGTKSGYGINVNASTNVLVEKNGATGNYFDGIGLLYSNDSMVQGNTVNDNHLI